MPGLFKLINKIMKVQSTYIVTDKGRLTKLYLLVNNMYILEQNSAVLGCLDTILTVITTEEAMEYLK